MHIININHETVAEGLAQTPRASVRNAPISRHKRRFTSDSTGVGRGAVSFVLVVRGWGQDGGEGGSVGSWGCKGMWKFEK